MIPRDKYRAMGTDSVTSESVPRLRQVSDLLSIEECASVIDAARPWLRPCAPAVGAIDRGGEVSAVAAATSVACLPDEDGLKTECVAIAAYLRTLVSDLSGLPEENQEPFQVVHQIETRPLDPDHGIIFPGWEYLKWESDAGGDRIFSFILYLNDVEEGGETDCPQYGIRIQPEAGKAAFWHSPATGYGRGFHASHPVTRGEKWVLACWVREAPFHRPSVQEIEAIARNGGWNVDSILRGPARMEPPAWLVQETHQQQMRTAYLGAGGPDCRGFEKRVLDAATFAEIRAKYASIQHRLRPEADSAIGTFLETVSRDAPPALFHDDEGFNDDLLERLRPIHEEWCGLKLEPSSCYGFRVYLPGAYLHNHVDCEGTHIVSSAICVDRDVWVPWPLHLVDIDGKGRDVDLEPGEFVLYESARIPHGRPTPLKGRFHVGLFLHYRPVSG
jgi:prolyl 4-hydroxylase